MSHFYADIQGNRGAATRQGTKNSGIRGHIRGWDVGIHVQGHYNKGTGEDTFEVYATSGSHDSGASQFIATVTRKPGTQRPTFTCTLKKEAPRMTTDTGGPITDRYSNMTLRQLVACADSWYDDRQAERLRGILRDNDKPAGTRLRGDST